MYLNFFNACREFWILVSHKYICILTALLLIQLWSIASLFTRLSVSLPLAKLMSPRFRRPFDWLRPFWWRIIISYVFVGIFGPLSMHCSHRHKGNNFGDERKDQEKYWWMCVCLDENKTKSMLRRNQTANRKSRVRFFAWNSFLSITPFRSLLLMCVDLDATKCITHFEVSLLRNQTNCFACASF